MMRILGLTLTVVFLFATVAAAQPPNITGLFFDDQVFWEQQTNHDTDPAPFPVYIVSLYPSVPLLAGYELSLGISDPTVFAIAVSGPGGWQNQGTDLNHLCRYETPLPTSHGGTILAEVTLLYAGLQTVYLSVGPSEPSSVSGLGPAVFSGAEPDVPIWCETTGFDWGYEATLNGGGVWFTWASAAESRTWGGVKGMFR